MPHRKFSKNIEYTSKQFLFEGEQTLVRLQIRIACLQTKSIVSKNEQTLGKLQTAKSLASEKNKGGDISEE